MTILASTNNEADYEARNSYPCATERPSRGNDPGRHVGAGGQKLIAYGVPEKKNAMRPPAHKT